MSKFHHYAKAKGDELKIDYKQPEADKLKSNESITSLKTVLTCHMFRDGSRYGPRRVTRRHITVLRENIIVTRDASAP